MKMAVREPLKVNLFIERDGRVEEFSGYTEEEQAAKSEELSKTMSQYFTLHPEEYARL